MKTIPIAVSVVLMVCVCQVALGATFYVAPPPSGHDSNPGTEGEPFATIQKGIDAASDRDTVIVAEGTYIENIRFKRKTPKNIVLRSTDPLDPDVVANTIIDDNQAGSVVTFSSVEDETCVLSGFTIRNGEAETGGGIWGGTVDSHTHATIRNNVITGNRCIAPSIYESGGGLHRCDGLIENNTISQNYSEEVGGGLAFCHGTIRGNTISANSAPNSSGGGLRTCNGTIESNVISGNSAIAGGGLFDCAGTIQNNVISGNSCERSGGGLSGCNGMIQNNVIADNHSGEGPYGGGGLRRCSGPIRNCIIWGNTAPSDA